MTFLYLPPPLSLPKPPKVPKVPNEGEVLTGLYQGRKVSDLEERSIRAAWKLKSVKQVSAHVIIGAPEGLPGSKELDLLIQDDHNILHPVQVDDIDFIHKTQMQQEKDRLQDIAVNEALSLYPDTTPVVRIPGSRLQNQEEADATWRTLEASGWIVEILK